MNRTTYWLFMMAAALMAGALVALPLWDYYHYRQPTAGGLPASPVTLAVMTEAPAPASSYTSAEPAARSWPRAETVLTAGIHESDGLAGVPEPASNTSSQAHVSSVAVAASVPGPATGRPTARTSQPRSAASPTWPGASPGARQPAETSPQEKSLPAANQAASIGWIAGGLPSGPPAMPAPLPQSTASNHDGSGQSDGSHPSGAAETVPDPQDTQSLRLSLAPDRHAVSRGQTFSVEVVLTGARDITSVPFHLQFDPGVLEYVGARTGPALNGRSLQPIFLAAVNPSRPGDLAVGLSLLRSSGTFSGSGAILLIDFRALAPGRSDLLFDRASVRGPTSELLPAEIVGSTAEVR